MKVVIELLGNESKQDLLATSNYLRELADGSLPVSTEAKVYGPNDEATANEKTDLDKLAEATRVKNDEKVEEPKTRRRPAKPAPIEEPAPAQIEEPEEVAAPAPKAPAEKPVEKPAKDETVHTVEECKQWAMKALNAKKRPLVQEAFEQVGATSFPTLKESMFAEFIEYISTRL